MATTNISQQQPRHLGQLARANNSFAVHLYRKVHKAHSGSNLFLSPLSISTALAMTYIGARGHTAAQMADVLRFKEVGENRVHDAFKELNALLYKPSDAYTLTAANKLYGKSGYLFDDSFLNEAMNSYGSTIEAVDDFTSPAAAQAINDWVSKQTGKKIQNLIAQGVLGSLTRLVLVNAIYFNGNWAKKFRQESTCDEYFTVCDERKKVKVKLMTQTGKFAFFDDTTHDCCVLEMGYKGGDLSMMIVLPNKVDGLSKLESALSTEILVSWGRSLRITRVFVQIPKFKLETQFLLNEKLKEMGMLDAFDEKKANFEGISGNRELFISSVIHKAFVDVNEEGSEAAAATAVVVKRCCLPTFFRADHPFLFMIRHQVTDTVLFIGRVLNPTED